MKSIEAADRLFRRGVYDDCGDLLPNDEIEAILKAIWALMDRAQYEK